MVLLLPLLLLLLSTNAAATTIISSTTAIIMTCLTCGEFRPRDPPVEGKGGGEQLGVGCCRGPPSPSPAAAACSASLQSPGSTSAGPGHTSLPKCTGAPPAQRDAEHMLFLSCLMSKHHAQCIAGIDLLKQTYVLSHRHRSCRSNLLSHLSHSIL